MTDSGAITTVFSIHRFVALSFGIVLFFFPSELNEAMAPEKIMVFEEKFSLQSWVRRKPSHPPALPPSLSYPTTLPPSLSYPTQGAFIIAVAMIAHFARGFDREAQRKVAQAMLVCFALETYL